MFWKELRSSARVFVCAAVIVMAVPVAAEAQRSRTRADSARSTTAKEELLALETRWNVAHVYGDTAALFDLWAEDIVAIVPEMRPFTKDDLKTFWRSGRFNITRHETSDITVRGYDNTAVVEGRLTREQSFSGRVQTNDWRFTKIYVKREGKGRVVSYHASELPAAR